MKFITFNGSPAGKSSATNRILEAFLKGQNVLVPRQKIISCANIK